jgi:hypothetical protein
VNGIPAALTVWVSSSEAYAEVQFDDDDPAVNEALLNALSTSREAIEEDFGSSLDWRGPEGLMTKRTKVVTPKVPIGDRADPTMTGLQALADTARRLVKAVQPHLQAANDSAATALLELESDADDSGETENLSIDDVRPELHAQRS